jgi:hypothetical protein
MSFLVDKYPVLTYGEKWVLWSSRNPREELYNIIVPWEWVLGDRCNSNVWLAWTKKASPAQCGVRAGEVYFINDPHRDYHRHIFFAIGASNTSTLDDVGESLKPIYMYWDESERGGSNSVLVPVAEFAF